MKKKDKLLKYSDAGLLCQIVLIISVLLFWILYMILDILDILKIIELILSLLMFVMAFNNCITFKRKYFTPIYILVGICSFILAFIPI